MKTLETDRSAVRPQVWTGRVLSALPYLITGLIGACGGAVLLSTVPQLFLLDEAGYGDSYILYDVLRLQKSGIIYRDLSHPPYLPAQYSPLVYIAFALPGKIVALSNPFLGPRLVVLCSFLACLMLTVSIVRLLIPVKRAALLAIGLAASLTVTWNWFLQIRADFPGIAFGLLSIRLLLTGRASYALWAGIAAGLALQFKLTFVAALLAGMVWLALTRQWRQLVHFLVGGVFSGPGLYWLYSLREPGMFSQILALSPGVRDLDGARTLLHTAVSEALFLLALVGLPAALLRQRRRRRWAPLLIYAAFALAIAAGTSLQAGANVNYYLETLFALTALALAGLMRLAAMSRRTPVVGILVSAFMVTFFLLPRLTYAHFLSPIAFTVGARNQQIQRLETVFGRYRVLSSVPRIALMNADPPLMEPYLRSYFHQMGRSYAEPALEQLRHSRLDGVITKATPQTWRGIPHIDPELRAAISSAYVPFCALGEVLVHAPASATDRSRQLADEMKALGCNPLPAEAVPDW